MTEGLTGWETTRLSKHFILLDGAVRIRRKDGRSFVLQPESSGVSPLDVEGVDLGVTGAEIVEMIREGRERYG